MSDKLAVILELVKKTPEAVKILTLSKPEKNAPFTRARIRPVRTKDGSAFYAEESTKTQTFHKNLSPAELCDWLGRNATVQYKHLHLETAEETFTLLTGKKGQSTLLRKKKAREFLSDVQKSRETCICDDVLPESQNRVKKYLIPEGKPVPFLEKLGVMNAEGRVFAAKYAKFRQINRFLEFLDDILDDVLGGASEAVDGRCADGEKSGTSGTAKPLTVIDYGCGKSYLTFAVYYYLEQRGIRADITGLDLKNDVVTFCNKLAMECGYDRLKFFCGDIASFEGSQGDKTANGADVVISLHACDTATDYALSRAVRLGAKAILAVPCCQHEINAALSQKDAAPEFVQLLRFGIIKERFAALATDVMRAALLEKAGYAVQILEFIDTEHTPKNLLLRAVKKTRAAFEPKTGDFSASYTALRDALAAAPLLEKLL